MESVETVAGHVTDLEERAPELEPPDAVALLARALEMDELAALREAITLPLGVAQSNAFARGPAADRDLDYWSVRAAFLGRLSALLQAAAVLKERGGR